MTEVPERLDPGDDPWLTVQQVSEELNVNPVTVRGWIKQERLRAVRAGKGFRVRRSELERALESEQSPPRPQPGSSDGPDPAVSLRPAPRRIADQIITVAPTADRAT